MNISASTIYLWQLADELQGTLFALCFISGLATLVAGMITGAVNCEGAEEYQAPAKKAFIVSAVVFGLVMVAKTLTPSSKTVAMMVVVPEIAKSKVIQEDVPELYNMAVDALKSSIAPKK